MSDSTYLVSVPVTPEYVLAVFRDNHRQAVRIDECCDPTMDLTLDSTVEEWRYALDLLEWRELGRAMNESWRINCSDAAWYGVLHPPRRRGACVAQLISWNAMRDELRPLSIAGTQCLPAAAFLAVNDCLASNGVDVSNLAPSTPLCEYARRNLMTLLGPISRLAPGALPDVEVAVPEDGSLLTLGCVGVCLGLLGLIVRFAGGDPGPVWAIALILQLLMIVGSWLQKPRELTSVTFGELHTFRDLANCIAAGVAKRSATIQ